MSTERTPVIATVRGVADVEAYPTYLGHGGRRHPIWATRESVAGACLHEDTDVTDRRPLRVVDETKAVVIEVDNEEEVRALWRWAGCSLPDYRDYLRPLLHTTTPPEPTDPAARPTIGGATYARIGDVWVGDNGIVGTWAEVCGGRR